MVKRYIIWLLRYRVAVLVVLAGITIIFGVIARQGVVATTFGSILFGDDHAGYNRYKQRIQEFANDGVFIICYPDAAPLSEESISRLEQVVTGIEQIPEVTRIDSLLNAQHTSAGDNTLSVNFYIDEALDNPENTAPLMEALRNDPFYQNLLISEDGSHAAIIVELLPDELMPAERSPAIIESTLASFEQAGFPRENLHRVGFATTIPEIIVQSNMNISRLFPVGCVILLMVVFVMFHRLWPVAITFSVSLVSVIWTFGFSILLDKNINIFDSISPLVILIVATSDIIHLCSAYLLELSRGNSKMTAILRSGTEVGTACFWTSATTFVGFIAMVFVPIPVFKQMGVTLGFGVAVSLLLAMTVSPILFSFMKRPQAETFQDGRSQRLLSQLLFWVEQHTFQAPWKVVTLFGLSFVLALLGIRHLTVETNLNERFDKESLIRRDEAYYNRYFAGANFLEIFLDASDENGVLDPDVFRQIEIFQQEIEALPEIDKVASFVDLIHTIDRAINPEYSADTYSPWTRELLAQYILLFESSGGEDLERFLSFDRRTMRLAARMTDTSTRFSYKIGNNVAAMAATMFDDRIHVETTGLSYLTGGFVDEVVHGQKRGFLFACTTIMLMMIIIFRSFRIGMWSMVPNVLPLLVLGGYLGFFYEYVDSDTFIVALIAIGIGVDDTIHFLSRLRFESARTADSDIALRQTFHFSGRAMVSTTLILVAGFLPFGLSDYFSIRIIGTLLPMTLIVALLADILLVPALVKLRLIRFALKQ